MEIRNVDQLVVHAEELLTCRGPREGLRGDALRQVESLSDGALAVHEGRFAAVGKTADILRDYAAGEVLDATGRLVSPGFVDSHSHLLHGGTRHEEYEAKVTQRAPARQLDGGIRFTMKKTGETSDAMLVEQALGDLDTMLRHGTTTLEAKTAYGLDAAEELRLLALTEGLRHVIDVVPTFLPLHVLPEEYAGRREAYLEMALKSVDAAARLARYCDVSCDPICFTYEECLRVGEAARALGMKMRLHADQFGDARGGLAAAALKASAADHLDYTSDEGFRAMARSGTVATFLPGVTPHMCEMTPRFTGCASVALGEAEIWNMCTLNAARSPDLAHDRGSLEIGKRADVVIWNVASPGMVINRFGINMVDTVMASGRIVVRNGRMAPVHRPTAKELQCH